MAIECILQEGVLNDDVLVVADVGMLFSGGYIGYIECWSYLNSNSDSRSVVRFRSVERLLLYLDRYYRGVDIDFRGSCVGL